MLIHQRSKVKAEFKLTNGSSWHGQINIYNQSVQSVGIQFISIGMLLQSPKQELFFLYTETTAVQNILIGDKRRCLFIG